MLRRIFYGVLFISILYSILSVTPHVFAQAFRFASVSDSHDQVSAFTQTMNQVKSLNPDFLIHLGDYEDDGVASGQMNDMTTVLKNAGLFDKAFIVRGNHDDHMSGSAALWESYFSTSPNVRNNPAGVTNYVGMDANSTYLTYSFDWGNSRFIGADVPGDADLLTSAQISWIDGRLTDAESKGMTHAFLYWHGPEYCVENTHCSCTAANDSKCTPSAIVSLINKHPIVSATFHGHEHVLGHVHMDSTRVSTLTHPYEEFFTSSAGLPYGVTIYPARLTDNFYSSSQTGFGVIDVNGASFTVSLYHSGTTPVWSQTFTKAGSTPAPTPTPGGSNPTPTPTSTRTPTPTPPLASSGAATPTPTPISGVTRPMKYYGVDRGSPFTDANYSTLASHAVKTIIVDTFITDASNSTSNKWANVKALADTYNFDYVIWPNQGGDVAGCRWEYPFNSPVNGNYIGRVTAMLDFFASDPHFIGMVSSHEPSSAVSTGCHSTIADMTAIKSQLKAYMQGKGRTDFKVWNYIDNVATNLKSMAGFTNADIANVMDVAVTWQHCFGGAEGTCSAARDKILADRALINSAGLDGKVELVYLFQTFATGGGYTMPTLTDMQAWDCTMIATNALDGFMYYTWGAWYSTDLSNHPELWPEMNRVYDQCVNKSGGTPAPTATATLTPTPTSGSNPNATPTPTPPLASGGATPSVKLGDANGDNQVNEADFAPWQSNLSSTITGGASVGDFDGNGIVDGVDYTIWLRYYGT